jgi:hypothetical protein
MEILITLVLGLLGTMFGFLTFIGGRIVGILKNIDKNLEELLNLYKEEQDATD